MDTRHALALVAASLALVQASPRGHAGEPPRAAPMTAAECEVWERELSFSKTVANHDEKAFAEHVHEGAVFNAGTRAPIRGRDAVVKDWRPIIEGKAYALHWHPGNVAIGGDPDIALSSGPVWTEDFDPKAEHRWTISRYTSTWKRDKDGRWRVLFDGSAAPPRPATPEEVAKLAAAQPATCPRGS